MRLKCKQNLYNEKKANNNDLYNHIINNKIASELKRQVIENQKIWFELASKDCSTYSFYVEDGTITHEIMMAECMTEKYVTRILFLNKLKDRIKDFE